MAADLEKEKFREVFSYLLSNKYPTDADKARKRAIRRTSCLFELKEGELVLKGTKRKWIPDKEQQRMIVMACHDDPLGKENALHNLVLANEHVK